MRYTKKNNFYEDCMQSAEIKMKQNGMIFDNMLQKASSPISEFV